MAKIITKETKPGKGISKDEPEKRRFFVFFEIYAAKFFKLIQLNFLYFVTLIPLMAGLFLSLAYDVANNVVVFRGTIWGPVIIFLSAFITGPSTAGFTYVLRNMQRREHTWIMSDFFKQFRKNFKQGSLTAFIDIICYFLLYVAFIFYTRIMPLESPEMGKIMPILGSAFVTALTFVYTWAHFYIYTMMVTFELNFNQLFKNSLIFSIAKLPLNIFITAIIALIATGLLWSIYLTPTIIGLLMPTIICSLIGFIIVFSVYPTIDKLLIQKVTSKRVLNTRG